MAAKMRAKLRLESVTRTQWAEELKFTAQYSDTREDNTFSEATPSASLTMQVTNQALWGQFQPGETYYLDFTPAEPRATSG